MANPQVLPSSKAPRRHGIRYSAVELLGMVVILFVTSPFISSLPFGEVLDSLLMTAVFVSAVFAVGAHRRTRWNAVFMMTPVVIARWLEHYHGFPPWVFPPLGIAFLSYVIFHLVKFALGSRTVNRDVLSAAIAAYLLIGLVWTLAYLLVGRLSPDAFAYSRNDGAIHAMNRLNSFYFSFVTLSTVGYGDISPVSQIARMLAVTEALVGTLYLTVLIARLVAVYGTTDRPRPPKCD